MLNYPTGRPIDFVTTRIGDNATVRTGTVIYTNVKIGNSFSCGHGAVIREENVLGDDCSIWSNSCIDYGCTLGNGVRIHNNVYIGQNTTIEDDVFIGPGATFANDPHPVCSMCMEGPTVRQGARIGAGAVLLPAVVIGRHALVGAGSVVTHDVPDYAVVAGNPARVINDVRKMPCDAGHKEKAYPEIK